MSVTTNTQLVSPSTNGRNIQLTPNGTADNAIVSGTVFINCLVIDNTNNAAASYFKMYDAAAPTVGTTAPDFIFKVGASEKLYINFLRNRPKFTTAISCCCVTAGGTAGTTSPTSTVSVGMITQTADDSV